MVNRLLFEQIKTRLSDKKAIILMGPRQAGKSTLVRALAEASGLDTLNWDGDQADIRAMLKDPTSTRLKALIGSHTLLVIDEAQRIENIGLCIKLIVDNLPGIKVMATGSSAFELANRINEPLTGRKWEYLLLPFSFAEMAATNGLINERRLLSQRLLYGYYPEVVLNPGQEKERITNLADSNLYKDILTWERIQKPDRLERLVQALAFQIGNQVSYQELGQTCGLDNQTVEKYITLLEKAFVVFRLGPFNRNLRDELKKTRKVYFYDNGLRNAVINQFAPLELRNDAGALWENWLMAERVKLLSFTGVRVNRYFWRTASQQEIDYVEENDGIVKAYEFKWSPNGKVKFPKSFIESYNPAVVQVITPDNFHTFLGIE